MAMKSSYTTRWDTIFHDGLEKQKWGAAYDRTVVRKPPATAKPINESDALSILGMIYKNCGKVTFQITRDQPKLCITVRAQRRRR